MTKDEFLWELDARLDALPADEREKSLDYYKEIIDDMTENGCTEEEAVAQLGPIEKIAEEILLSASTTEITATSGNVVLDGYDAATTEINTTSGDVNCPQDAPGGGTFEIHTTSGGVKLSATE